MKAYDMFIRGVNLFSLSGYLISIMSLLDSQSAPLAKVNGVFHLFLLVFLMTLEIQEPAPNLKYLAFMSSSFGKGLFYLWLCMVTLNDSVLSIVGTSITGFVALCYVASAAFKACCCSRRRKESAVTLNSSENATLDQDSTPLIITLPNNGEIQQQQEAQEEHNVGESSNSPTLPLYTPPVYTKTDYNQHVYNSYQDQ